LTDGEIVSVDSMQVYRGMDIGTAKPDVAARRRLPHHLVDIADPEEEFSVARFQAAGRRVLATLAARQTPAVIVGGSGLHYRALVDPLRFGPTDPAMRMDLEAVDLEDLVVELLAADPAAADHVDLANPRRVVRAVEILRLAGETPSERASRPEMDALRSYRPLVAHRVVGVDPGDELEARVTRRFDDMLAAGLLDEVAGMAGRLGRTARQAVGYKELLAVVAGERSLAVARGAAIRATLALAKRQRTFFRRDPRIRWIPWDDDPDVRWMRLRNVLEEDPA
jgi:tRNA dimethylallyltransferase